MRRSGKLSFAGLSARLRSGVRSCGAFPGSACRAGGAELGSTGPPGVLALSWSLVVGVAYRALGDTVLERELEPNLRPARGCFREGEGHRRRGLFHVSRCRACGGSKASKSRVWLFGVRRNGRGVTGLERGSGSP